MRRQSAQTGNSSFQGRSSMLYYENRFKDEHVWCTTRTWRSERRDFCRNSSFYKLAKELLCETLLCVAKADTSVWYLKDLLRPLLTKPPHTAFYGMHKTISAGLDISRYVFFFFFLDLKKDRSCSRSSIQRVCVGGPSDSRVSPCVTHAVTPSPPTSPRAGWGEANTWGAATIEFK